MMDALDWTILKLFVLLFAAQLGPVGIGVVMGLFGWGLAVTIMSAWRVASVLWRRGRRGV